MSVKDSIFIKGARANNLKNIDLEIPRGKFVVITGVSGSGKSSLAFDTLYAEGHRRFAESLSSFARQFLGRVPKPAVDYITGIPPAIAVEQKINTVNSRSTIATTTEIYSYLQILFAKIGHTFSPVTGSEVVCDTERSVLEYILTLTSGTFALIAARLQISDDNATETFLSLKENGYTRVLDVETGEIYRIDDILSHMVSPAGYDTLALLIDRLRVVGEDDGDFTSRTLDSLRTAFEAGQGHIFCGVPERLRHFSNIFEADGITFERPTENLFSYNSPLGACPVCGGFGNIVGIDENLVIPNPTLSVFDGAVACWRGELMKYFKDELVDNAYKFDFPIFKPYKDLTSAEKDLLWRGNEHFTGIDGFFDWVNKNRYKIQFKYMQSRYSGKTTCRECGGTRLRKEALYVRIGGKNIAELMSMQIRDLAAFFDTLALDDYERELAAVPLKEIRDRLRCIVDVGLGYLTLDRASATLSGGESQRINLVKVIGNNLVGSMYVLDEPSIGLHSCDTQRLIAVLRRLRDLGNTVVVVEHDREIIAAADHIIDFGPMAGSYGGEVVYQGPPAIQNPAEFDWKGNRSLTLEYLAGRRKGYLPQAKHQPKYYIEVEGACHNNLNNLSVRFPLRCLVAVTGVSGSGKSSLVGDILYPALNRHINQLGEAFGAFKQISGDLKRITAVEYVDQNPIGKSSRSNPVTYTKVYDDIRKLYSEQPYAKMNGYGHSHFSFNIDGGRCPECQGEGVIRVEMQFMADVTMMCPSCGGKRFLPDILEVKYQGKSISDVLDMSVEEAIDFFSSQEDAAARRIAVRLQPLMDVGLSYLKLGQSSSTLSGGESQRIKLASFLGKDSSAGAVLFIFDEPTTGLHFYDIEKLLRSFDALIAKGHSIIVVEHNLDIIRAADHIIELGPGAGDEGGNLVFEGTPEELVRMDTPTEKALNNFVG
ncbi:MAG: excinuclease ABC subunit UvrA [Bacteroidales bacterium]|nr:excinuclease ABC subunit UvrA [Bacteroidales bacterium]